MNFTQLEAFSAVVEWNSFSIAAKKLYLTQPTISAHINSLEEELNTKLIIRTTKKITITKEGFLFYEYANSILNLRQKAYDEFNSSNANIIRLGASTIPSSYILPKALSNYRHKFSNVSFDVWQCDSFAVIQKVIDGSLDIGLVGTHANDENCISEPFFRDELVIATPVNNYYKKLKKQNVSIETLLKEPIIMRENGSGTQKEFEKFIEKINISIESLNIVARMNDQDSITKTIVNGMGISAISRKACEDLEKEKKLLIFPLGTNATYRNLYIVYSKNKILSKHINNFIKFMKHFNT